MALNELVRNPYLLEFARQSTDTWSAAYYTNRHELVRRFAWGIPSHEALEKIVQVAPRIIEIGAGTGYWAMLLSQYGCDVIAYDTEPHYNAQAANEYYPIEIGGPEMAQQHSDRALFLCWPPYNEPMATDALLAYEGDTLLYIGEGMGGCTANDEFHGLLGHGRWNWDTDEYEVPSSGWTLVETVDIPQWDSIHDNLSIYKRKIDNLRKAR